MPEQNIGGYYVPNYSNIVNTVGGIAEQDQARRKAEAQQKMKFEEDFREQSRGFDPVFMVMEENMQRQKAWEAEFISSSAKIHQDISSGRKSREEGLMEVEDKLKDLNLRQEELLHYQKEFQQQYSKIKQKPSLYNKDYYDSAYESYRKTGVIPEGGMLKYMPLNKPQYLQQEGAKMFPKAINKDKVESYNPKTGKVETKTVTKWATNEDRANGLKAIWDGNARLQEDIVEEFSALDEDTQKAYEALGAQNVALGGETNDALFKYYEATYGDGFMRDAESTSERPPNEADRKKYGLGDDDSNGEPLGLSGETLNYEGEDIPFVKLSGLPNKDIKVQPSLITKGTDLQGNPVDFKDEAKAYNVVGATKYHGGEFLIISVNEPSKKDSGFSMTGEQGKDSKYKTYLIPVSGNEKVAERFKDKIKWDEFPEEDFAPMSDGDNGSAYKGLLDSLNENFK